MQITIAKEHGDSEAKFFKNWAHDLDAYDIEEGLLQMKPWECKVRDNPDYHSHPRCQQGRLGVQRAGSALRRGRDRMGVAVPCEIVLSFLGDTKAGQVVALLLQPPPPKRLCSLFVDSL